MKNSTKSHCFGLMIIVHSGHDLCSFRCFEKGREVLEKTLKADLAEARAAGCRKDRRGVTTLGKSIGLVRDVRVVRVF